jgi:hypothetical protein
MPVDRRVTDVPRQVIGNFGSAIDEVMVDMSDLIAQRARTQSRAVLDYLGRYGMMGDEVRAEGWKARKQYERCLSHVLEP